LNPDIQGASFAGSQVKEKPNRSSGMSEQLRDISFYKYPLVLALFLCSVPLFCQKIKYDSVIPDSILEKKHSPVKAALMSICLPGLGQAYNKKYWKIPIVYAGLGVLTYFIVTNAQEYSMYKNAYIESVNNDTTGKYQDLVNKYSSEDLLNAREYYRRNLEVTCILTGVWYILNIVDAAVDAHLFTYNISKNLSMNIDPVFQGRIVSRNFTTGIRFCLRF
jgi:hypothetical protein